MSTRGSVCWRKENGEIEGVYNHMDSYPSYLGVAVFEAAKLMGIQGLIDALQSCDDWRQLGTGGICEYCGKPGLSQPHSISGSMRGFDPWTREEFVRMRMEQADSRPEFLREKYRQEYLLEIERINQIVANRVLTGYPDPDGLYHQHSEPGRKINPFKDPLFMEWIYLLDPEKNRIEVWKSISSVDVKRMLTKYPELQHSELATYSSLSGEGYCEILLGTLDPVASTVEHVLMMEEKVERFWEMVDNG